MNCRWSTVYTFPSSLERLELRCDVITLGQDVEKAAPLEMFIAWVRASLTLLYDERTSRCLERKATGPHFYIDYSAQKCHTATNVCYVC